MWDGVTTAHRQSAKCDRMNPGDPSTPGRGTNRGIGKAVKIKKAFPRQLVQVWGIRMRIPITTHPLHIIVLTGNPKDIGAFRSFDRKSWEETKKD